jgi:hypothetical protein
MTILIMTLLITSFPIMTIHIALKTEAVFLVMCDPSMNEL